MMGFVEHHGKLSSAEIGQHACSERLVVDDDLDFLLDGYTH